MSRAAALDHIVWELTLACDQKCLHCGSRGGKPRRDELTTREALDLVAAIAELGALEVTLIGGEAYLRRDWSAIAAEVVRCGMQCSMVTGGRHFDAGRAAEAAAAGIDNVSISIDGIGATHDQQRGPGSFAAAVTALRHLRAAGVRPVPSSGAMPASARRSGRRSARSPTSSTSAIRASRSSDRPSALPMSRTAERRR